MTRSRGMMKSATRREIIAGWFKDGECRCTWCGGVLTPEKVTVDHLRPLALGGGNRRENLVPACGTCNHARGMLLHRRLQAQEAEKVNMGTQRVEIECPVRHNRGPISPFEDLAHCGVCHQLLTDPAGTFAPIPGSRTEALLKVALAVDAPGIGFMCADGYEGSLRALKSALAALHAAKAP